VAKIIAKKEDYMQLKPIDREAAARKRAKNWQAVKGMGLKYTRVYLILTGVFVFMMVLGIILLIAGISAGGGLLGLGFVLSLVVLGGMTIVANIAQGAKNLKKDWKGENN
jgi:hypothetical protein